MSLWLKTLKATAEGDRDLADRLLNTDLGLAICARQTPSGIWQYQGVLPERVQQFVRKLPGARREFALPRQDELTDYIFDQLYAAIERCKVSRLKTPAKILSKRAAPLCSKRSPTEKIFWRADFNSKKATCCFDGKIYASGR